MQSRRNYTDQKGVKRGYYTDVELPIPKDHKTPGWGTPLTAREIAKQLCFREILGEVQSFEVCAGNHADRIVEKGELRYLSASAERDAGKGYCSRCLGYTSLKGRRTP